LFREGPTLNEMKQRGRRIQIAAEGTSPRGGLTAPRGGSLIELMITVIVLGVLVSLGIPRFQQALERSRADVAGANLRAIWTAQRLYWLDNNKNYAPTLQTLYDDNLLDPNLTTSNPVYSYQDPAPDPNDPSGFIVQARRVAGSSWSGVIQINAKGEISSTVTGPGGTIIPAFQ
jgi:type II secretory pathway pseudopilin PulG